MSFERVCALSDVAEPGALRIELADIDIAVVRFEGQVYAVEDVCSHAEVALSEGEVERFKGAPFHAPLRRLDETRAARTPVLRWRSA